MKESYKHVVEGVLKVDTELQEFLNNTKYFILTDKKLNLNKHEKNKQH